MSAELAKKKLEQANIPATTQRVAILEYLIEHRTHPSADEIYKALKDVLPILSKATVYNTLQTLTKAKIIDKLSIEGERARYDFATIPHHHFFCKKCGKLYDVAPLECKYAQDMKANGHKIEYMQAYFFGICKHCLKKSEK